MAYIRHKIIKGHLYYYLVEGRREGSKVRQIVLKYLGKNGALSASSGVVFSGFSAPPLDEKQSFEARQRIKLSKAFKALGYTVRQSLSGRNGTRGKLTITRGHKGGVLKRSVSFIKNPPISTMSHELGHALDFVLRDKGKSFWETKTFKAKKSVFQDEFRNVGKDKYSEALERDPSRVRDAFFQKYVFSDVEGYANSFELFLTDYKKALRVVPNMVAVFHEMIRDDDEIRQIIERLDAWAMKKEE